MVHLSNIQSLGAHGIRELRDRLSSRWPISTVGPLGYSRARRLRAVAAAGVLESTCPVDWFRGGFPRFIGERETQGASY